MKIIINFALLNKDEVNRHTEYKIPFVGLKEGIHEYEFHLDSKFFEEFELSEFTQGEVDVKLSLDKRINMMVLDFELEGNVTFPCDRCGEDTELDIEGEEKLIVQFGDKTGSTDEEILILGPNEYELDISQYLFEFVELLIPARRVHASEKECNQDVMQKLGELEKEEEEITDPRWDALKGFKSN